MDSQIFDFLDNLLIDIDDITANRVSIINGKNDFTEYNDYIFENSKVILDRFSEISQDKNIILTKCVYLIILAEINYQKNECYTSLVLDNSSLAFLEFEGNDNLWFVARYLQLCIMIVTGQLSSIFPLVYSMKSRVYESKNAEMIRNYEALRAWCALYDDDWETINIWLDNSGVNDFDKVSLPDTFCLMVKARIYYTQGRYYLNETLLRALIHFLETKDRPMELCEAYMLLALNLKQIGNIEQAFKYFEKCLEIASERTFIRLLADEGEPMYLLAKDYMKSNLRRFSNHDFLKDIVKSSMDTALMHPQYLKNHINDYPKLTEKEKVILKLLVDNKNVKEMADFLDNSINTIKHHLKNVYKKLGVNCKEDAVNIAKNEFNF